MTNAAPRIAWPLVAALPRLDGEGRSVADVWRDVGALAVSLGLPRPSYEQVRVLLRRERAIRSETGEVAELALDGMFRTRSPHEAADRAWESIASARAARERLREERSWRER